MSHIERKKLTSEEVDLLIFDTISFQSLIYVPKKRWLNYKNPHIIREGNSFVGVCVVYELKDWIKIGPIVVLKKYQGKGYGKKLLYKIAEDYRHKNIFITSSNPNIKKTLDKLNFTYIKNYFSLPFKMKLFLIKQLREHLNLNMLIEFIRKRSHFKREKRYYYIKYLNKVF